MNILISRTDGLGDVILALPMIPVIKENIPDSKIFFLTSEKYQSLLNNYKDIDEFIYIEKYNSISKLKNYIKSKNIDVSVSVFPVFKIASAFYLAGVKTRIGTAYRWYSFLFNNKVFEHRKYSTMHESEYNLNLLKPLSSNITTQQPAWSNNLKRFYFDYTETESENLKRKLEKSGFDINSNYIIIHPGSKSSAKDLPLNKLNNYINRFLKNISDFKIVITGTKEEKTISEKIISSTDENSNGRIFSFIDCLTLKELLILIDKSKLFISNSTGPLHMAGALNKNIICFFPNSKPMNPERWKPLSENPVIFTPEKDDDMSTINPENIIKSTINILKPFIK